MSNRITTATLAHYLGAECEMRAINTDHLHGCEDGIYTVNGATLNIIEMKEIEPVALILRPIESMTQEDILGLTTDKVNIEGSLRAVKNRGITGMSAWLRDHSETFIIDYLRSKGFDLGGEIEQDIAIHSGPFGETVNFETNTVWVPSLIGAGVAKEVKQ